jgi:hypothetical protein
MPRFWLRCATEALCRCEMRLTVLRWLWFGSRGT